jgi:hypothetical protein
MTARDSTIGRLSVRLPDGMAAGPTLGLRIERLIDEADWQAFGAAPGEILIIRHLRDLPSVGSDGRASAAWRAAVQVRLDDLRRRAARPAWGSVPAHAESVLFADEAELIACCTRDLLAGTARWYWRMQFAHSALAEPGAALAAAWITYSRALPQAARLLPIATWVAALARLDRAQTSRVVRALHEAFTLPEAVFSVELPAASPAQAGGPDIAAPPMSPAPWAAWLPPSISAGLMPQTAYLGGLALALAHTPAAARSQLFARAAAEWLQAALSADARADADSHTAPTSTLTAAEPDRARGDLMLPETVSAASPLSPSSAASERTAGVPIQPDAADMTTDGIPQADTGDGATRLGGVFYLVHLLDWLGLPGELAAHASGWALIELFARALIGERLRFYADDPVWALLAQLDGRAPDVPVGAGWPSDRLRWPGEVLRRHLGTDGAWTAAVDGARVRLAYAGVFAYDAPLLAGDPTVQIESALRHYSDDGTPPTYQIAPIAAPDDLAPETAAVMSADAADWLRRALPLAQTILQRRLRCEAAALSALLIEQRASVTLSRTHVDVTLPMEAIRIPVRLAGLDRDPGWQPDLGYVVLYHFV